MDYTKSRAAESAKHVTFLQEFARYTDFVSADEPVTCHWLFFHKDLTSVFGLCPFILLTDTVVADRKMWLEKAGAKHAFEIVYSSIVRHDEVDALGESLELEQSRILEYLQSVCTPRQLCDLEIAETCLAEFVKTKTRNKAARDKFSGVCTTVARLSTDLGIKLHCYLTVKWNVHVFSGSSSFDAVSLDTDWDLLVEKYTLAHEKYETTKSTVYSTEKFLDREFERYITGRDSYKAQHSRGVAHISNGTWESKYVYGCGLFTPLGHAKTLELTIKLHAQLTDANVKRTKGVPNCTISMTTLIDESNGNDNICFVIKLPDQSSVKTKTVRRARTQKKQNTIFDNGTADANINKELLVCVSENVSIDNTFVRIKRATGLATLTTADKKILRNRYSAFSDVWNRHCCAVDASIAPQ